MRLSPETTKQLPTDIAQPSYLRKKCGTGIVHFGIGAFHRAHQAVYTDDVLKAMGGDWGITGVSLRSANVAKQMNPQGGLYTVTERSASGLKIRMIGAVKNVLVAPENPEVVIAAISAPDTHIVSFTITEKGYCRASDGSLDLALADDNSVYAYLAAAFRARKDAGLSGLTLMSCDNLAGNGAQLARLLTQYLQQKAPDVLDWFGANCTCPSTMVDRIVPATTEADRTEVSRLLGMDDEAAIITEPFTQWVIEDKFAGPRPAWESQGAQITRDVHAYENAKLRMLNGAHSALAYLGLKYGHEFVHQAIGDAELAPVIESLMRDEAAASLTPAQGQDLTAYADALIVRFQNPALNHRLIQIGMDGSQKVPQRWLDTLAFHQNAGRQCPAILAAIGAWLGHIRGDNGAVDDPLSSKLKTLWDEKGRDGIIDAIFSKVGLLASEWRPTDSDKEIILNSLA